MGLKNWKRETKERNKCLVEPVLEGTNPRVSNPKKNEKRKSKNVNMEKWKTKHNKAKKMESWTWKHEKPRERSDDSSKYLDLKAFLCLGDTKRAATIAECMLGSRNLEPVL